jgi:hypothetical protein
MIPKKFHRNLGTKNIQARESPSIEDIHPQWNAMRGEKAQHNERAEWIREQRRKVSNMDWTKEYGNHSIFVKNSQLKISWQ